MQRLSRLPRGNWFASRNKEPGNGSAIRNSSVCDSGGIKQLHTFLGVNGKVTNVGILAAGLRVIIVGF